MESSRPTRIVEPTQGGGNCAFNAFILAISSPSVEWNLAISGTSVAFLNHCIRILGLEKDLGELTPPSNTDEEELRQLSEKIRQLQNVVSTEFKKWHKEKPRQLQDAFHVEFRSLACFLAKQSKTHLHLTMPPLLAAFDEFLNEKLDIPYKKQDDIFLEWGFIQEEFSKFYQTYRQEDLEEYARLIKTEKRTEEEQIKLNKLEEMINKKRDDFIKWWWPKEREKFLDALSEPGKYAGDIELAMLADFFRVNLVITKDDARPVEHNKAGSFSAEKFGLDKDLLRQLSKRVVIGNWRDTFPIVEILLSDKKTIHDRLDAIPDHDTVVEMLDRKFGHFDYKDGLINSEEDGISPAVIAELRARNLIEPFVTDPNLYKILVETQEFKLRIAAIDDMEIVEQVLGASLEERPSIYLKHSYLHWENTLTPEQKQELGVKKEADEESLEALLNSLGKPKEDEGEVKKSTSSHNKALDVEDHERGNKEDSEPEEEVNSEEDEEERAPKKLSKTEQKEKFNAFIKTYERAVKDPAIKHDSEKWKRWSQAVKNGEDLSEIEKSIKTDYLPKPEKANQLVDYQIDKKNPPIEVTQRTQIALDRELAKKVHAEINKPSLKGPRK